MKYFLAFALMLIASPAYAYIGPGLGIAAIWMLPGPIAAIIATVALIGYFPARWLYKKHKAKKLAEIEPGEDK